jgi:hypothetical protein
MTRPTTFSARPGRTALIARIVASWVRSTSSRSSSVASPARNVPFVSPWTPPMNAVTSMLTMSPSWITVESGMPWQMTSFRLVQHDFGKPR